EAEGEVHAAGGLGAVVRDAGGGHVAVGDVYLLPVRGDEGDVKEAGGDDRTRRRAQLDEVAGGEGPRHEQREAGKDVRERVLQREREGQARHGEHGHERGRGYAELVRYYERDEHPEQHPHAGEDEAAYGALELGALK